MSIGLDDRIGCDCVIWSLNKFIFIVQFQVTNLEISSQFAALDHIVSGGKYFLLHDALLARKRLGNVDGVIK